MGAHRRQRPPFGRLGRQTRDSSQGSTLIQAPRFVAGPWVCSPFSSRWHSRWIKRFVVNSERTWSPASLADLRTAWRLGLLTATCSTPCAFSPGPVPATMGIGKPRLPLCFGHRAAQKRTRCAPEAASTQAAGYSCGPSRRSRSHVGALDRSSRVNQELVDDAQHGLQERRLLVLQVEAVQVHESLLARSHGPVCDAG
jgi:hypothetical protein